MEANNNPSATVAVARYAMATRFEIVLHGPDAVSLRAAGEEALNEIDRLEGQLSLYRSSSQIAHVNARAAVEPVRVDPALFQLLQHIQRLSAETGGAFDITIGPLMRCWGFMQDSGRIPDPADLERARTSVGLHAVSLDPGNFTVRFLRPGLMLDLGAVGKGYAIEKAAEILREAGVTNAIIHGGTSTVFALGAPPDADAWKIALEYPPLADGQPGPLLAVVSLRDESLSVSAVWGKSFQTDARTYGHVIDPRTGNPTSVALMAAVVHPSATETDAFSTALLVTGPDGLDSIVHLRPGMRALVLSAGPEAGQFVSQAHGIEIRECVPKS